MVIKQYCDNLPKIYQVPLKQFASMVPDGIELQRFEKNPFPEYDHITKLSLRSDLIRCRWLAEGGDVGYADADTFWLKNFDFAGCKKDKPWIGQTPSYYLTCAVMFSFGHVDFFKEILRIYEGLNNKEPLWLQNLVGRYFYNDVYRIPFECFAQPAFSMLSREENMDKEVSCSEFTAKREDGEWKIKRVRGLEL